MSVLNRSLVYKTLLCFSGMLLSFPCLAGGMQILSPADGAVVSQGQALPVMISADSSSGPIVLETSNPALAVKQGQSFGEFYIDVPANTPSGAFTIKARGANGDEASIKIDLERADKPEAIRITPNEVFLTSPGKQQKLFLEGYFLDGTRADLTHSTQMKFGATDEKIAWVTPDGLVTAAKQGDAAITVNYADYAYATPVHVRDEALTATDTKSDGASTSPYALANNNIIDKTAGVCSLLGASGASKACPNPIWRANTYDVYDLSTGLAHKTYIDTQIVGARLDPGVSLVPIHAFDKCYFFENKSTIPYFIPFKTLEEWTAFIDNHPTGVIMKPCTLRAVYTSKIASSKGDHAVFNLPGYATQGAIETQERFFRYGEPKTCDGSGVCTGPTSWKETITVTFVAGSPTWKVQNETVSKTVVKIR